MKAVTVTAKGWLTRCKELLKHLGVQPGDKIAMEFPGRRIEIKAARPAGKISDAFNLLKGRNLPSLWAHEINELAKRGWARRR